MSDRLFSADFSPVKKSMISQWHQAVDQNSGK